MAIFVVGDIHGQYKQLKKLLSLVKFHPQKDTLWCTGDLVNRGKKSLEVMQFCHDLNAQFLTVLGNHDVFLLALYHGYPMDKSPPKCLERILKSPQVDSLMTWLGHQPFFHYDDQSTSILVHAGIPPLSDLDECLQADKRLQAFFQSSHKKSQLVDFLCYHMMGNEPRLPSDIGNEYDDYRYFINCFTRMRYCDLKGAPRFGYKGKPSKAPSKRIPWFALNGHRILSSRSPQYHALFGHWATLHKQPINVPHVFHLDDACAWGGYLTALCLSGCEERGYPVRERFCVNCA